MNPTPSRYTALPSIPCAGESDYYVSTWAENTIIARRLIRARSPELARKVFLAKFPECARLTVITKGTWK